MFTPIIVYTLYISQAYFFEKTDLMNTKSLVAGIAAMFTFLIYYGFRYAKFIRQRRDITLQLECEIAVSQELNQLMRDGYYIYHDFPADGFNIDHIVIGKIGVFVVETLARNKPITKDNKKQANLIYNGTSLQFPTWIETKPLEQVEIHAKWLAKWLIDIVGNVPVKTIPVLVLPGWFVEEDKKYSTKVINPKRMLSKLKDAHQSSLSDELVVSIARQVEACCRDIKLEG